MQSLIVLTLILLAGAYFGARVVRAARSARRTTAGGCGGDCCGKE